MDRLEAKHIKFLRECAGSPNKVHEPTEFSDADAEQMANEGLLIVYRGATNKYAITAVGSQVSRSYGPSEEITKLAKQALKKAGCPEEEIDAVVEKNGAEEVLKSLAQSEKLGQGEVRVPLDERGNPTMKFYKP